MHSPTILGEYIFCQGNSIPKNVGETSSLYLYYPFEKVIVYS